MLHHSACTPLAAKGHSQSLMIITHHTRHLAQRRHHIQPRRNAHHPHMTAATLHQPPPHTNQHQINTSSNAQGLHTCIHTHNNISHLQEPSARKRAQQRKPHMHPHCRQLLTSKQASKTHAPTTRPCATHAQQRVQPADLHTHSLASYQQKAHASETTQHPATQPDTPTSPLHTTLTCTIKPSHVPALRPLAQHLRQARPPPTPCTHIIYKPCQPPAQTRPQRPPTQPPITATHTNTSHTPQGGQPRGVRRLNQATHHRRKPCPYPTQPRRRHRALNTLARTPTDTHTTPHRCTPAAAVGGGTGGASATTLHIRLQP